MLACGFFPVTGTNPYEMQCAKNICTIVDRRDFYYRLCFFLCVLYGLRKSLVYLVIHGMKRIVPTLGYGYKAIESISDLNVSYHFLLFDL